MRRSIVSSVVFVALSCSRPHVASVSIARPPPIATGVADAAPPVSAEVDDRCGSFDRKLDATLHTAIDAMGDAGTSYGDEHWTDAALKKALPSSGLGCLRFGRGAWLVEPAGEVEVRFDLEITTQVAFRAVVDGRSLDAWAPDGGTRVGYGGMPTTMERRLVTDYDGDGIPELWARTDEDGVEGGHFAESWVLTVHDGKVGEYGPATKLGELGTPVDVDGDGRLDLPVSLGLGLFDEGECYGKSTPTPADFIANSLAAGTFSTTDAVATQYVKKWCPAAPPRIRSTKDALCARMWAAPADVPSMRARIAASCVPWDCSLEYDGKPQKPRATHDCNDLLHTFDQSVPFTLR